MTKALAARLRELNEKATPGPWVAVNVGDEDEPMFTVKAARIAGREPKHEVALCATGDSPQPMETANAHLIAGLRNSLPAILTALEGVEEMRSALIDAREMVASWGSYAREFFQAKHDLEGDIAKLDAIIARAALKEKP